MVVLGALELLLEFEVGRVLGRVGMRAWVSAQLLPLYGDSVWVSAQLLLLYWNVVSFV